MKRLILLLSLQLAFISLAFSQSENEMIYSVHLQDSVEVLRFQTGDVQNSDSLNVLILLDGDEYFGFAKDILTLYVGNDKIQPTILIGLPSTIESRWKYYTPTNSEPYESSDSSEIALFNSSGEFGSFQNFIEKELLLDITSQLKDQFINCTIFGHSIGGLGALGFLIHESDAFQNYILASPSLLWDNYFVLEKLDTESKSGKQKYDFQEIYISVAEFDLAYYPENVEYFLSFIKELKSDSTQIVKFKDYEGESHYTVGLKTLFDGIQEILIR